MENQQEVRLRVEDKKFIAKKDVLIKYSDYFRAMFSGNFIEKEQHDIRIDVVDSSSMEIILKYMELGFINLADYSLPAVGVLCSAAVFLQINELTKLLDQWLEDMLTPANWLEITEIARKAPSPQLEQAAVTYGLVSLKNMKPEHFPTIQILFWYLSHPYLHADSELEVFTLGSQWCESNLMNAHGLLIILCCLDYTRLKHSDLIEMKYNTMLMDEDFVFDVACSSAQDVINGLFHISKVSDLTIPSIEKNRELLNKDDEKLGEDHYNLVINIVRNSIQRKLKLTPALALWNYENKKRGRADILPNFLYTYSHETGFTEWIEISEKNYWGWSLTTWSPTKIVMCCGEHGRGTGKFVTDVKVYDILKKKWIHHGVELPPRRHAGVAIIGDELYILGGVGGYSALRPSDDSGQTSDAGGSSAGMRVKYNYCGRRYCFNMGGVGESKNIPRIVLDTALIYHLKKKTFRQIANLPDAIQSPVLCVHANVLYVAAHNSIYKYVSTQTTDRWEEVMDARMTPNFLVPMDGYILVVQSYVDWLFRFKPGVDTTLKDIAKFEHPPTTLCVIGSKIISFTFVTGDNDKNRMTVAEYRIVTRSGSMSRRIRWSQEFNRRCVNTTGHCVVLLDPPPINTAISEFHQGILTENENEYFPSFSR